VEKLPKFVITCGKFVITCGKAFCRLFIHAGLQEQISFRNL